MLAVGTANTVLEKTYDSFVLTNIAIRHTTVIMVMAMTLLIVFSTQTLFSLTFFSKHSETRTRNFELHRRPSDPQDTDSKLKVMKAVGFETKRNSV